MINALPQIVCLLDAQGRILHSNRTVEAWGLVAAGDTPGMGMHELLHPGCDQTECYLKRFLADATDTLIHGSEAHCHAEDALLGRHLDIKMRTYAHPETANGFAVAIVDDVSELMSARDNLEQQTKRLQEEVRKRTLELSRANQRLRHEALEKEQVENDLRQSRDEYRMLVETMNEGLAIQDKDGRLVYVNQGLSRMLGYSAGSMIGRPLMEFIDEAWHVSWQARMGKRWAGDQTSYEMALTGQEGPVWVKVSPSLIQDSEGGYAGCFAVITDISEHMRSEQALRDSKQELHKLTIEVMRVQEKERQRIASELHDGLGQTLSAIKFHVENSLSRMRRNPGCGPAQMQDVIPLLQGAIEEVRNISMNLRPSMLDDFGILATLEWFSRQYQACCTHIRFILQIRVKEEEIPTDLRVPIFRIVQEALNNAARHSDSDRIRVRLRMIPEGLELEIRDWGRGMDLAEIARRRAQGQGGMGLVNMRQRAEAAGGRFLIESSPKKGTCISIVWPRKETTTDASPGHTPEPADSPG